MKSALQWFRAELSSVVQSRCWLSHILNPEENAQLYRVRPGDRSRSSSFHADCLWLENLECLLELALFVPHILSLSTHLGLERVG